MEGSNNQQANLNITNFINNVLTDLKNLTNSLRSLSRQAADNNNSLINRLLLGSDRQSLEFTKAILSHLLHIVDLKGISPQIMSILGKVIAFVKIIDEAQGKSGEKMFERASYRQQMSNILYHVIDIVQLLKNKFKDMEMVLRIIQTAFSLIDTHLLQYANEHIFIRIYAICFDCCLSGAVIQNISVSALFALTEIIFSAEVTAPSLSILEQFLEFVLNNKRFTWLKDIEFKGIVWDLIIVAIRHYPIRQIQSLANHKNVSMLLNAIYKNSMQKVFLHIDQSKGASRQKANKKQNEKNNNFKKGNLTDFIRYYKSFIYFSIQLSIKSYPICGQIVPFRQNLGLLKVLNELQRGIKLYILLQGITLLIIEGHFLLIEQDKAIILLDVICKVIEELCLSSISIDLSVDSKDFYLDKMCGDFNKIGDSDHARLIRNLIIRLRKQFEKGLEGQPEEELNSARSELSQKEEGSEPKPLNEKKRWDRLITTVISIIRYLTSLNLNEVSNQQPVRKLIIEFQYWFLVKVYQYRFAHQARSELSQKEEGSEPKPLNEKKRWDRLITTVISIIRYLTSLNLNEVSNQQPVRKLIIEFQYWFLICPSSKTRNFILQELLNTSTLLDNKMQAIKASQCVQLGSNLIYGYYHLLDSLGLTTLLHMMAGVQTSWQDGRGFDELDEVCSMADKLYSQQRLVHSPNSFRKTLQALVQCANAMLADLEKPKIDKKKTGKSPQDRCLRLLDYTFGKLRLILEQNLDYLSNEWNFVTGFWISCCSHQNTDVQTRTMSHLASIVPALLKKSNVIQQLVLSTYAELAKLKLSQISKLILQHVKLILASISTQQGVLQLFHIMRLIAEGQGKILFEQVYELQEMIIKQALFRVVSAQKLSMVIDAVALLNNDNKQQYKTVNLVWSIFDHMKTMNNQNPLSEGLWIKLFNKIYLLSVASTHGQTRQSCIHTLTQLIAEISSLIPQSLFVDLLNRTFLPLFLVLLGIHQKTVKIQNIAQAEAMKVGIKNFAKIIRKCCSEKIMAYKTIIDEVNQKLLHFLCAKWNQLTIQYCHELCPYFQLLKSLKESQTDMTQIKFDTVKAILQQLQKGHDNFDKSSVYWRKKYEPVFSQLKQYFSNE